MAVSPRSYSLRSPAGYGSAPSSTNIVRAPTYRAPSLPQVPQIDDARAPNSATRAWLAGQLGELPNQLNANLTNIRAGAKQALTGYGGWKFRQDDPNTPEREDLILDFDAGMGLGEREKLAVRGERNASNSRGTLYSSFTDQNIGQAVQRLSLEAQQIATQYASSIQSAQTNYANQVANITGQWTQLYGQDAAFLAENPPPPPDPLAGLPRAADNSPMIWRGKDYPNMDTLRARYPGQPLGVRRAGDGSYVVVIGEGAALPPAPNQNTTPESGAGGGILWKGQNKPNMDVIRQRYGNNVQVKRAGNGTYVVVRS